MAAAWIRIRIQIRAVWMDRRISDEYTQKSFHFIKEGAETGAKVWFSAEL